MLIVCAVSGVQVVLFDTRLSLCCDVLLAPNSSNRRFENGRGVEMVDVVFSLRACVV